MYYNKILDRMASLFTFALMTDEISKNTSRLGPKTFSSYSRKSVKTASLNIFKF